MKAEYMRTYRNTPNGKKRCIFANWNHMGLVGNYEEIYERFINTTNCDKCNVLLTIERKGGNQKHMDHCHRTGIFRNILCLRCNSSDTTRVMNKNQKYGHKGLTFIKSKNLWSYRKLNKRANMNVKKMSSCKIKILCIKFAYLILLNHRLR
mgnify:CR=1 FL=1